MAPLVQTPVRVPFLNPSAPPADSTCRSCVLSQPPDQNCANRPMAFTVAGGRCCCQTNWWRNKAGRHRFYTLFCICTAASQNEPCKEFMVSLESSKMPTMSKELLQSSAAGAANGQESCFPCSNCHIWELNEPWMVPVLPWWLSVSLEHSPGQLHKLQCLPWVRCPAQPGLAGALWCSRLRC